MNKQLIKYIPFLIIAILTFAFDFISKQMVLDYFNDKDVNYVQFSPFFNLVLSFNAGVSFGMFNDHSYDQWIFIILTSTIIFAMFCWLIVSKNLPTTLSLGLIIGGAFGNLVNRFTHGAVIDFLDFHIGLWHYPAFNVADAAICLGVFILIFFPTPKKTEVGKFA